MNSFNLLVITPAQTLPGEQGIVRALFGAGLGTLHLRKPGMNSDGLKSYINSFSPAERSRIRAHSTDRSLMDTGIGGLHLPFRSLQEFSPLPGLRLSTSIHSWAEYASLKNDIEYVFISPVYDSLSKPGYLQCRKVWKLPARQPLPVIALGGIRPENILKVKQAGFRGAALLGSIWQQPAHALGVFNQIRNKITLPAHE